MNDARNRDLIRKHEGCRTRVYADTQGIATIGVGFNLETAWAKQICAQLGLDHEALVGGRSELSQPQTEQIFELQYRETAAQARRVFPEIDAMPEEAAAVVCDMLFELGADRFAKFPKFIAAVKAERWAVAIQEMEESLWARQVPNRVGDNVRLMEQIGAEPILRG